MAAWNVIVLAALAAVIVSAVLVRLARFGKGLLVTALGNPGKTP